MYHGTRLNCHSEERSDVGISCNSPRIRRGFPTIRLCTAEIAASACGLLAMTNLGSITPINLCRKYCHPARRSLTAIGSRRFCSSNSAAQSYQICHSEERSDVGISGRQLRFRR